MIFCHFPTTSLHVHILTMSAFSMPKLAPSDTGAVGGAMAGGEGDGVGLSGVG